ncbi:cytochrome c [Parendozoicomonas sp. Alg238-R29]|uniref:c-type cytochrome n=1 Tax=Parendozoicomonas sp. Alg238-R29 TaxID=2993446 RepID=UPI00248F0A36|nr:cytochrome c [Parendozoicomonas sp. Alg238-R29]
MMLNKAVVRQVLAKGLVPFAVMMMVAGVSAHSMDFGKDDDAVYLRKAHMALVGTYFGDMGAMIKGKKPFDAAQFQSDADRLAVVTQWSGEGFEKKHLTSDSKAKPEIWEDKAEFDKLMKELADHAGKLKIAAASGNMKDSVPAFKAMADNCGSCHKKFKNK